MENLHLRIFQQQLRDQCQFFWLGVQSLEIGHKKNDHVQVWYGVQNILTAGANISKMLWGSKGRRADARRRLRESVEVSDDSPLRDVTMRNHYEHMDERIDRWWDSSETKIYVDKNIGSGSVSGLDTMDNFRWLNPSTGDLIFWGETFNLRSLAVEVDRILAILEKEADKPHWELPPLAPSP
jgi:hypothetical protein